MFEMMKLASNTEFRAAANKVSPVKFRTFASQFDLPIT